MSDESRQVREDAGGTEAIRIQAADWVLAQRLAETWSEADQAALDSWLGKSLANRLAYLRLEAAWIRTRRIAALRPVNHGDVEPSPKQGRPFPRKIAAASIALAVAGAVIAYSSQQGMKTYATAVGNHSTIVLLDGSKIELNTNTILRVSDGAGQRTVMLDQGEAFFHIKHDVSRPFTVLAAGHRITDLGTEFTVRRDSNDLTVSLLEGRARFDSADWGAHTNPMVLSPGDILKTAGNSTFVARQPVAKLARELAWRRGALVFENATLADAARELNRYNVQKIVIADEAVKKLKFDASIPTNGVQVFTRVAREVFDLRVDSRANEVVISR